MPPSSIEVVAAVLFGVAVVHTFAAGRIGRLARRFPRHSGLFHLLGEVEVVFGFWAIVLLGVMALAAGGGSALAYAESRDYTEPLFVFVIMVIAASRPILETVLRAVNRLAASLPAPRTAAVVWLGLAVVPLLGSLVTEPAAMTIAALMLAPVLGRRGMTQRSRYFVVGVLFVNVSIGGTLTSYAAPPVLMVASTWQWDSAYMFATFGWKSAVAVGVNASVAVLALRRQLAGVPAPAEPSGERVPPALVATHLCLLAGVVFFSHRPVAFLGLFLLFLGLARAYRQWQQRLIVEEALLVAFFLAGLVVLGGQQRWWLQPIVAGLEPLALYFGALALTAVTDNAALTYLGSLIVGISDESKHALVAGAVAGGGLTVIANAPNPAGVALLRRSFADQSIGAAGLLAGAALPTAVATAALLLL